MKRRKKTQRQLKTTIFIICEGKNTEPNYFKAIKEEVEDESSNFAIEIHIHETETTHAKGLVEEASLYVGNYNEVWAVFDKDGYTKHQEAFDLASNNNVNIAFSSIAFEHWVLLHYQKNASGFFKSEDIIDYLYNENLFSDYQKKKEVNIYPKLADKTHIAIENANWLRHLVDKYLVNLRDFKKNPYITLDRLICRLLSIDEIITFGEIGHIYSISNLNICITEYNEKRKEIKLNILNNRSNAFIINQVNLNDYFFISDEKRAKYNFKEFSYPPLILAPGQSKELILFLEKEAELKYLFFNFKIEKERLLIALKNIFW